MSGRSDEIIGVVEAIVAAAIAIAIAVAATVTVTILVPSDIWRFQGR